jgi:hypothetical protein
MCLGSLIHDTIDAVLKEQVAICINYKALVCGFKFDLCLRAHRRLKQARLALGQVLFVLKHGLVAILKVDVLVGQIVRFFDHHFSIGQSAAVRCCAVDLGVRGRRRRHRFPVDFEFCNAWLIGCDRAHKLVEIGLGWRIISQLGIFVLVVNIVADSNELLALKVGCNEDHSHANRIINGNFSHIRGISLSK